MKQFRKIGLLLFLSCSANILFCQTEYSQRLEELKTRYYTIIDSIKKYNVSVYSNYYENTANELINRATEIISHGNYEQGNVAKFFRIKGSKMLYDFISGQDREKREFLLKYMTDYNDVMNNAIFPIKFGFEGKRYEWRKEDFANYDYAIFYDKLGYVSHSIAFFLNDTAEYRPAIRYYRLIVNNAFVNNVLKCEAADNIVSNYGYMKEINADKLNNIYYIFNTFQKKFTVEEKNAYTAEKANYPLYYLAQLFLEGSKLIGPYRNKGQYAYEIAGYANAVPDKSSWVVWNLYKVALEEGLYKQEIYQFCLKNLKTFWRMSPNEENRFDEINKEIRETGIKLLLESAAGTSENSCPELLRISGEFSAFGDEGHAAEYKKKSEQCLAKIEKERKRQERLVKHQDGIKHVYLGFYPFALLNSSFEAQLDLRSKKHIHSFGAGKITQKQDWTTRVFNHVTDKDNLKWYGFRMNYAIKWAKPTAKQGYTGVMVAYSQKNFKMSSVEATVNNVKGSYNFKPSEIQVEAFVLMGMQSLKRIVGMDITLGFGLSYNRFDGGNAIWHKPGVTIDNQFLTTRKASTFYPQFKFIWSFGFHFHRKGDELR